MIKLTTKVSGVKAFEQRLKRIHNAPQKLLVQAGKAEVEATKKRIQTTKTDPDGRPWSPWSFATLRQRQREGSTGGGLLYKTGALFRSITYKITRLKLTVFTDKEYGRFLQFGTPKMPAREFLGWGKTAINTLEKMLQKEVRR